MKKILSFALAALTCGCSVETKTNIVRTVILKDMNGEPVLEQIDLVTDSPGHWGMNTRRTQTYKIRYDQANHLAYWETDSPGDASSIGIFNRALPGAISGVSTVIAAPTYRPDEYDSNYSVSQEGASNANADAKSSSKAKNKADTSSSSTANPNQKLEIEASPPPKKKW